MTDPEGVVSVELYVRSELPPPARDQADAVYRRLVESGRLGNLDRTEWPKRVPVDGCDTAVRDAYLSFVEWATERGVSLRPFFATRECYCEDEGGMVDWLVVPAFCLTIYEGERVSAVYPHADATDSYTVHDGVDALETEILPNPDQSPASAD